MNVADLYSEYRASLAALEDVPGRVAQGVAAARRTRDAEVAAAETDLQHEYDRLASLRRTARTRYASAVGRLAEYGVALPGEVRPADASGSLKEALEAHAEALRHLEGAFEDAKSSAQREAESARQRAAVARESADALRARQEKLRLEREASDRARQTSARRRRAIVVAAGAVVVVLIAVVIVLFLTA